MSTIKENVPHARKFDETRFIRLGWIVIVIGLVSFLLWAAFAPLDKGVPATGTVIVSGNRKVVQSPLNGTVAEILVKDGDRVQAGEPLIRLDKVLAEAKFNRLRTGYITALATEARLIAERDGAAEPVFSPELESPEFAQEAQVLVALQRELFKARTRTLENEIAASKQSLAGISAQLRGLTNSLKQKYKVADSLRQQLNGMRDLAREGFVPRNRWMELERQQSELQGQIAEMNGEIERSKKQQEELQQRIQQRLAGYQQEVQTQLAEVKTSLSTNRSELRAAQFELEHTEIRAPTEGRVISLTIFNPGTTVTPVDRLMEIVPLDAKPIVDARLSSHLIDKVYPGLEVNLMFSAFNQNKTPVIPGRVSLVSADRLVDNMTGEVYYKVQVSVTDEGMALLADKDIRPGMPVEVLIRTGSRTMLNYLFKPLFDRARTALTEE